MSFRERYLVEEAYDDQTTKNTAKNVAKATAGIGAAGALGYGLGTGNVQETAKHVWNQPISQTTHEIGQGIKNTWNSMTTSDAGHQRFEGLTDKLHDLFNSH